MTAVTSRAGRLVGLATALCAMACLEPLHASTIALSGVITQSTQDGTGPAVNNPGLNNILDGSAFTFVLDFMGMIAAPGTQDLTGANLLFSVPGLGAFESGFDFTSLTISKVSDMAEFSLFACLKTGSGCNQGNELDLSFTIPSAELSGQNVAAQEIPGLLPLDLLEDDGVTDIQGVITHYSGTIVNSVPEPTPLILMGLGLIALFLGRIKRQPKSRVAGD